MPGLKIGYALVILHGALWTEICQRAAKLAIRQSIEADIRKARGKWDNEGATDVDMGEDEDKESPCTFN